MNPDEFRHTTFHGTFGLLAGAIGAVTSFLPQIEQWLRILVLLASLVATCLSVWKLLKGKKAAKTGGVSLPAWTLLVAFVLCFVLVVMAGCSPAPSAKPTTVQRTEQPTTMRGSDGRLYSLVKRGVDAGPGNVSSVDEWQPVGEGGIGRPVYNRRLQATWDASDPIFIKVGVLE